MVDALGLRFQGLGCGVSDVGFRVQGVGFGVWGVLLIV